MSLQPFALPRTLHFETTIRSTKGARNSSVVKTNENNYEITIPQKDFDDYVLICCYQGDDLVRSFQTSPAVIDYDIEFHDAQGNSKCRHYKDGYISYIPPSIYCKIGV